jgi:transposase
MGRYTLQKKLAAVEDYGSGESGLRAIAQRHDVDFSSLRQWVAAHRAHGIEGLKDKRREFYSAAFKLEVLQRVQTEGLSYRRGAALFNIRKFDIIGHWKRQYDEGGVEALSRGPGRSSRTMIKQPISTAEPQSGDDDKRTRQQLLDELNQLRMENAYLKKLEALAQGSKQTTQRKERKSYSS